MEQPVQSLHAETRCRPSAPPRTREPSEGERIVRDAQMARLDALARSVAVGNISVLLTGETGCGKEVFAESIHRSSRRADRPFVSLNCAALSETLLESELFGHERGAFTGATQMKLGLLESADGGTVFLDEIGEMPPALQAKLLRVLEQRSVLRVGALKAKPIDVRFVSATNRDLEAEVERGAFRRDLYYRINGVVLAIPPLRERRSEIEPLARLFVERSAREAGRSGMPPISPGALARLLDHDWPGNVRELRNVMERAVLLSGGGDIGEEHLGLRTAPVVRIEAARSNGPRSDDGERPRILEALGRCGGNQTKAAKLLGIGRQTLIKRIAAYGIPRPKAPAAFSGSA